jgi:hypothetical protein
MGHILSVDWDFFLPDTTAFDWGIKEAPFWFEPVWITRADSWAIGRPDQLAVDIQPDSGLLTDFWKKVCPNPPRRLVIRESHSELWTLLEQDGDPSIVINYDAHHDLYYEDKPWEREPPIVECGSWAGAGLELGLISSYTVVYPQWRRKAGEYPPRRFMKKHGVQLRYQLQPAEDCDVLFICRSPSWSPTWCDDQWLEFIHHWQQYPDLWDTREYDPTTETARHPNRQQARDFKEQIDRAFAQLREMQGEAM